MLKSKSPSISISPKVIWAHKLYRFLLVGRSLHIVSFLAVLLIFIILNLHGEQFKFSNFKELTFGLKLVVLWLSTIPILSFLDSYGRYQDYKLIKDKMYLYGANEKLLKYFMHSRCQREATWVASRDFGKGKKILDFFNNQGYHWYHVLPDSCLERPLILFTFEFWKKIFFRKYYKLQNFYW